MRIGDIQNERSGKVVTFTVSPGTQGVFEVRERALEAA
jgi:hypothetical protein